MSYRARVADFSEYLGALETFRTRSSDIRLDEKVELNPIPSLSSKHVPSSRR